nr:hypothetical protein [Tanacetum cinerariifolium]
MKNLFDKYVSCLSGKMTRKPFPHRIERGIDLLEIIHTDVFGPLRQVSRQGASYFITFTDDYSHYGYVYLLKHKHEVFETFKVFKNEVKNVLGKTIKPLRSDRGGKYIGQEFKDYQKAFRFFQQLTPPYTPQHNGVFRRRNHTLLDLVRSMMNLTTLLLSFWDYALETATRILNMVPTKKVHKTPYELWIPKETMGYYFYFPPVNKIIVARYAEFLEKNLLSQEIREEHSLEDLNEPANYKAAILDLNYDMWLDAMNSKMQSIKHNQFWCLVDLPSNCKTVGSKWLFKKNTDMYGIVHTYKSCLVAKGFTQTYRVDYEETFSPVADIRAIRILIAIAAFYDYEIWKIDVKTAFLNGYIDEDIFMVQPKIFIDHRHPRKGIKEFLRWLLSCQTFFDARPGYVELYTHSFSLANLRLPLLSSSTSSPSNSVNMECLKANEEPVIQPVEVTTDSGGSPKPELFVVYPGSATGQIKDRKCKKYKGGSSRPPVKRKLTSGSSTSHKGECDVTRSRERARDEECKGLQVKREAAMTDFKKNPAMLALREKIYALSSKDKEHKLSLDRMMLESQKLEAIEVCFRKEVKEIKYDRREVVSKVVPYAAMELVYSDDIGFLVGKLVSSAIVYGRCKAFEQVAGMKEPFDFSKVKGYCSSNKKDHTQASNDLPTATFHWLDKFVADPSAPIKALLSKKPPTLQRPTHSRT